MIDTIGEMLDLPKNERSRYLAKLMVTRTYVFDVMERAPIHFIRKTIVRCGGVYRECYRNPGVYWVATFRDQRSMQRCTRVLTRWLNRQLRESAELHGHLLPSEVEEMMYGPTFGEGFHDVPALEFTRDVWIGSQPRRVTTGFHPVEG